MKIKTPDDIYYARTRSRIRHKLGYTSKWLYQRQLESLRRREDAINARYEHDAAELKVVVENIRRDPELEAIISKAIGSK